MTFCLLLVLLICASITLINAATLVNKPINLRNESVNSVELDSSDSNASFLIDKMKLVVTPLDLTASDPQELIRTKEADRMKLYMDESVDPCEDFYQYACGNWEKVNTIPKDQFQHSSLSLMQDNLLRLLEALLSEKPSDLKDSRNESSAEDKAKYFYVSCMNSEMREKLGSKPLFEFLNKYGHWPALDPAWNQTDFDWVNLTAHLPHLSSNSLLPITIEADWNDSKQNVVYLGEPQLTLSQPNFYLNGSYSDTLDAYHKLIKEILLVLDVSEVRAEENANEIIAFEKELAKIVSDPTETKDLEELYNRHTIAELMKQYTNIDWFTYFTIIFESEVTLGTPVIILYNDYLRKLPGLLDKTAPKTIVNYILWRYVKDITEDLDSRFEKPHNEFIQALTGQRNSISKRKKCIQYTKEMMGMAVGAMFVRRHFDESSKADVIQLTREVQQSFRDSLQHNTWIDQSTKQMAEQKANATTLQVGYLDSILISEKLNERYKDLTIDPDNYIQNSLNLAIFERNTTIRTHKNPIDKAEMPFNPAVINAYFEQTKNQIIIPAVILQSPIYNRLYPRALNYGGIGFFVGHELTHGFDVTGRNFDLNGDMKKWWTNSSIRVFKEQAECFAKQYDKYLLHGLNIDGNLTKGENIADNGGIQQAYWSYTRWLEANPDEAKREILPRLNIAERKLFFLGFAQIWCGIIRPEAIENKLHIDEHSPGKFRVLGTLSNFEEFSKEFQCPLGSGMNPRKKCKLW